MTTINTPIPIKASVNTSTVPTAWGGITGTLANQTDLAAALAGKLDPAGLKTINGAGIVGAGDLQVSDYISVKQYGAVGDGVTDDSKAIALALGAARIQGKDLFFPSGTYYVNSFWNRDGTANTTTGNLFDLGNGSPPNYRNMRIFGERKTKITSSLIANGAINGVNYFVVQYNTKDVCFENIFFESTHAITTNQVVAVQYSAGSAGNTILNPKVLNCVFEGFSPSIQLNGTVNAFIAGNVFNAPKGREQAQNNSNPACFITMSSNNQAQVINPIIVNNFANGYSNTAAITTMIQRQLMDNFVQGDCVGGLIANNYTRNLGTEHIIVAGYNGTAQTNAPVSITGNVIDCTIPAGTYRYQSSTPLTVTVGIRADKMNLTVSNNIIYNASWGILLYGANYPTVQFKNTVIDSNTLFMHNDSSNTSIVVQTGIQVQGYNGVGFNLLNGIITNNKVIFDGVTLRGNAQAFAVNDCIGVTLKGNITTVNNVTNGGFTLYHISATRTTGNSTWDQCNNEGALTGWVSSSSSTITRTDATTIVGGGGGGGGGSSRTALNSVATATDANQTAAAGVGIYIPNAVFTTNRTVDLTALNTEGDYFELYNYDTLFNVTPTGQAVYLSDGTTLSVFPAQTAVIIRRVGGVLRILN